MAYSRKHSKKHSKKHAKRGGNAHACSTGGGRKLSKKHSKKHSKRGGGGCNGSLAGGRKHKTRRGGKSLVSKSMLAKASGLLKTAAVPFGLVLANSAMKKRMSRKSRSRR